MFARVPDELDGGRVSWPLGDRGISCGTRIRT
jgi:hypothetical protein